MECEGKKGATGVSRARFQQTTVQGVVLLNRDGETLSREKLQGGGARNQQFFFGQVKAELSRNF